MPDAVSHDVLFGSRAPHVAHKFGHPVGSRRRAAWAFGLGALVSAGILLALLLNLRLGATLIAPTPVTPNPVRSELPASEGNTPAPRTVEPPAPAAVAPTVALEPEPPAPAPPVSPAVASEVLPLGARIRLPQAAGARVLIRFDARSPDAAEASVRLAETLRIGGLEVGDPVAAHVTGTAIEYAYTEDQAGAALVAHDMPGVQPVRRPPADDPFPRPGTITVEIAGP